MNTLDHYTPDQLRRGISDLMYFLANPRLDAVIWRMKETPLDGRREHRSEPREDSVSDLS